MRSVHLPLLRHASGRSSPAEGPLRRPLDQVEIGARGRTTAAPPAATDRFESILWLPGGLRDGVVRSAPPAAFHDLHLDQIVDAVTAAWDEYDLRPLFYTALTDPDAIVYRQEVMQDLEDKSIRGSVETFAGHLRTMRGCLKLAATQHYQQERERWYLAAVLEYCDGVAQLSADLGALDLRSRGLGAFRAFLAAYTSSKGFVTVADAAREVRAQLASVRYSLLIRDGEITVRRFQNEPDYTSTIEHLFERFRREAERSYLVGFPEPDRVNHIEAQIQERAARLYPEPFTALTRFVAEYGEFVEPTVARFDREVHFYLAYLAFIARFKEAGLTFCYPRMSSAKSVGVRDGFDLALATVLIRHGSIVTNDFALQPPERVFIVTGPNQGGKTTFARMFGQLHHLGCLGCPVPGSEARLFLCDRLFTHFDRREDVGTLRGKLQDDLIRLRTILDRATASSIVIVNEIFGSTTLHDALYLSRKVMDALGRLDCLAVCVTFLDELAARDGRTVSLVSGVDPRDPTVRTFRLERRPANGMAYALAVAEKYRVTGPEVRRRIRS